MEIGCGIWTVYFSPSEPQIGGYYADEGLLEMIFELLMCVSSNKTWPQKIHFEKAYIYENFGPVNVLLHALKFVSIDRARSRTTTLCIGKWCSWIGGWKWTAGIALSGAHKHNGRTYLFHLAQSSEENRRDGRLSQLRTQGSPTIHLFPEAISGLFDCIHVKQILEITALITTNSLLWKSYESFWHHDMYSVNGSTLSASIVTRGRGNSLVSDYHRKLTVN
jgi:hypothetical protein